MKKIRMTMATSHVDLQGERLTPEALESLARQIREHYIPINVNHDVRRPIIGRIVSAEVTKLLDGESAVIGIGELYEKTDVLTTLTGDGRKMKIRDKDIKTISVGYDLTFSDEEGQKLLQELSQISGESPSYQAKKALEPVSMLLIAAGIFILGSIGQGFFGKIGEDLYYKLRNSLVKYYKTKKKSEQVLRFCFPVKKGKSVFEVNILITNPTETEINVLFDSRFKDVDSLLISLPLDKVKDISQIFMEYKNQKLSILYVVRNDAVPFSL